MIVLLYLMSIIYYVCTLIKTFNNLFFSIVTVSRITIIYKIILIGFCFYL